MKYDLLAFVAVFIFSLTGCKKDPRIQSPAQTQVPFFPSVQAQPPFFLAVDTIANNHSVTTMLHPGIPLNNYNSRYSDIDIDSDGRFDYRFEYNYGLGPIDAINIIRLKSLQPDYYFLSDSIYTMTSISHTQQPSATDTIVSVIDSIYVKPLKIHDTIWQSNKFRTGNAVISNYTYLTYFPNGTFNPPVVTITSWSNPWKNQLSSFIGIQAKGNLGWINLNINSNAINGYCHSK